MHTRIPRGRQGHLYLPELYSGSGPPPDLANLSVPLTHRFRPDQGVTTSGTNILSINDLVGDWHQTASTNPQLNTTDAAFGNKPTIYAPTSAPFFAGAVGTSQAPPVSIMMVGRCDAQCAFMNGGTSIDLLWGANLGAFIEFYSLGGVRYTPGVATFNSPFFVIVTDDGTVAADACKLYHGDLTAPKAMGTTKWSTTSQLNLCASTASVGNMRGVMAELAIWGGVLSPSDRTSVDAYCARYGL